MDEDTNNPPTKSSTESSKEELQLAKSQGDAYTSALKKMSTEVAESGGEKRAGEYIVAYAVEKAEGLYHLKDGKLEWEEPKGKNAHFEVSVRDASDLRFIPGLDVRLTVLDNDGKKISKHKMPFLWHPWLYHYGRNWKLPGDGEYTLRIHINVPSFSRHDKKNGKRYTEPVEVEFKNVSVKTGKG
jgi:hypothetical protein